MGSLKHTSGVILIIMNVDESLFFISFGISKLNAIQTSGMSIDSSDMPSMKHEHFKLVHVSVSDTDTPQTHFRHATWRVHFFFFCIVGHGLSVAISVAICASKI